MEPHAHLPRHEGETAWTATGHERPVFLDEHGRRRRWVLAGGVLAGGASAFWFTALVAGAIGFSTLPSVRVRAPFVVQRAEAHEVASLRHRHTVVVSARRTSSFARATGLAVSRGLIPGG
jgi:hypothetical protein